MRPTKPIFLALTLALTLPNLAAWPQAEIKNAPPSDQEPLTLHVTSRETVVDITVTDAKGQPIHGLKQSDFILKEDGKPQPIRSFEEVGNHPAEALPALPPNVYTNLQPPPTTAAVNVLLLDNVNTAPFDSMNRMDVAASMGDQTWMKSEAAKYLKTMPPGTRVAVLGMGSGIRILQGFTSNPDLLSTAVNTMEGNLQGIGTKREQMCAQLQMRDGMTLESLNWIATYLSGIKGRKNLIWLTRGIPTVTEATDRPPCLPDYDAQLHKAYDLLAASQVTVYPVYSRGLAVDSHPAELMSMEAVAEATGGVAYYNSNDGAAGIAKAIENGSDYYSLSYVPPSVANDGRFHAIDAKVEQPGAKLVYRKGYYADVIAKTKNTTPGPAAILAPPESYAGDMRTSMTRGVPTSAQFFFDVQVKPSAQPAKPTDPPVMGNLEPKFKSKSLTRYGFQYAFPASNIAFTDGPNGMHNGALEIDIAAFDAQGKLVTGLGQTVKIPITAERYRQFVEGPFRFLQQVDLPAGPIFLRIGIRDTTSNKIGTLEIPLTVPKNNGR